MFLGYRSIDVVNRFHNTRAWPGRTQAGPLAPTYRGVVVRRVSSLHGRGEPGEAVHAGADRLARKRTGLYRILQRSDSSICRRHRFPEPSD